MLFFCCVKEMSHWDVSFTHPKHMFDREKMITIIFEGCIFYYFQGLYIFMSEVIYFLSKGYIFICLRVIYFYVHLPITRTTDSLKLDL